MREQVLAALDNRTNLPAFPLTAQRVLSHLANPQMNMVDLADTIKTDQAYASIILRMVNSAGNGLPRSVTNMSHAINFLGLLEIRKLVYALSARSLFDNCQSYIAWSHSLTCGYVGEMAAKANKINANDGFVASLFHDVGKLFFYKNFPAGTALIYEKAASNASPLLSCELNVLGIDHAEVGSLIVSSWLLGPSISLAIQNHHRPFPAIVNDKLSCVIAFANQLAHQIERPEDKRYTLDENLVRSLGLAPCDVENIREAVSSKVAIFQ